jgi:hypothetical protein
VPLLWLGRAGQYPSQWTSWGGAWRQFHGVACDTGFLQTHGTLLHRKTHSVEVIVRVVAAMAEGLGVGAVARVFDVDPNTVRTWLSLAADQLAAFFCALLHDVHITQVRLDEFCAWVSAGQGAQGSKVEAREHCPRSPSPFGV